MNYIHSSLLNCHGRLKSRNCIIDAKFTLKISDYGVNRFNGISSKESCISNLSKGMYILLQKHLIAK